MFMLLPPLSVMVLHTGRHLSADLDAASSAARLSMLSVPMLFCWAIPYFYFCAGLTGDCQAVRRRWLPRPLRQPSLRF